MADVAPPKRPIKDPDRLLDCEEAMEAAFQTVIERAAAAGWSQEQATLELITLIQAHVDTMRANEKTEETIAKARRTTLLH